MANGPCSKMCFSRLICYREIYTFIFVSILLESAIGSHLKKDALIKDLYAYCTLVPGTMATSRPLSQLILFKHTFRITEWRSNTLICQKLLSPSLKHQKPLKIAKLIKGRQRTRKLAITPKTINETETVQINKARI